MGDYFSISHICSLKLYYNLEVGLASPSNMRKAGSNDIWPTQFASQLLSSSSLTPSFTGYSLVCPEYPGKPMRYWTLIPGWFRLCQYTKCDVLSTLLSQMLENLWLRPQSNLWRIVSRNVWILRLKEGHSCSQLCTSLIGFKIIKIKASHFYIFLNARLSPKLWQFLRANFFLASVT